MAACKLARASGFFDSHASRTRLKEIIRALASHPHCGNCTIQLSLLPYNHSASAALTDPAAESSPLPQALL